MTLKQYKEICANVLLTALEDISKPGLDSNDARGWITSDSTRYPYAYKNICTVLGLNPENVRAAVKYNDLSGIFIQIRRQRKAV